MKVYDPLHPLKPGSLLLEASAGTGKTHALTDLVLRLVVEAGLPIQAILLVTFTVAATAELKVRVRQRLAQALECLLGNRWDEDEVLKQLSPAQGPEARLRLERALSDVDEASISTIHGFCQRVLQQFGIEAGVDPERALLQDARPFLETVATDFWVREAAVLSQGELALLQKEKLGPEALQGLAVEHQKNPDLVVQPWTGDDGELKAARAEFNTLWAKASKEWAGGRGDLLDLLEQALKADCLLKKGKDWAQGEGPMEEIQGLESALQGESEPASVFVSSGWTKLLPGTFLSKAAGKLTLPAHEALCHNPKLLALQHLAVAAQELGRSLSLWLECRFLGQLNQRLMDLRELRREQTFGDLLVLVRQALPQPGQPSTPAQIGLANQLRQRYSAVLIDEFQDTDPVQWGIFSSVWMDGSSYLYLVGDPKQAIYSFRGADLPTYLRAVRAVEQRSGPGGRVSLPCNYRSDADLVEALNAFFLRADQGRWAFANPKIEAPRLDAHHPPSRLALEGQPLSIRFLAHGGEKPMKVGPAQSAILRDLSAQVVALLNRAQREDLRWEGKPFGAGDIAVLARSNHQALAVQRALLNHGVPTVVHTDESVVDSEAAADLEALLAALVDPRRDSLRSALASSLFGVDVGELALLRSDEGAQNWGTWLGRAKDWLGLWERKGVLALVHRVLGESEGGGTQRRARLLSLERGQRYLTDLNHMAELMQRVATEERLGPEGCLAWLAAHRGERESEGRQIRLESDTDAVQVLTVHKSKGLQFGVVFLPFLWKGVRKSIAPCRVYDEARDRSVLLLDGSGEDEKALLLAGEQQSLEEELRLVYVAMTRARHQTVLWWGRLGGGTPNFSHSGLGWLLHPNPSQGLKDHAAAVKRLGEAGMLRDLAALGAEPGLEVVPIDEESSVPPYCGSQGSSEELKARGWTRKEAPEWGWRRRSYSTLIGDQAREDAHPSSERDHLDRDLEVTEEQAKELPWQDFPRVVSGRHWGTRIHAILETVDFASDEALETSIADHVPEQSQEQQAAIHHRLRQALSTPLWEEGPSLRDVDSSRRLNELRFEIPLAGGFSARLGKRTTLADIADCLTEHQEGFCPEGYLDRLRALSPQANPLRGFLTGFVDLVFEHEGRFWVVDYKTNRLGSSLGAYGAPGLDEAMTHHDYPLQALLYAVALRRYLAQRLGPGDHVGGVAYLFLRGMLPEAGPQLGVWQRKIKPELLHALDTLLEQGREENAGDSP